jgi:RNA polymerase sigma-70 factor, ECF subfamily
MTDSGRTPQTIGVALVRSAPGDFRALFEREFNYVWNTLRRLGVHGRDLEDVAHDVFVQVHRHFSEYEQSRPLRPWLFGFAFRVASDYRKLARHRVELLENTVDAADGAPSADDRLAAAEDGQLVARALDAIDLDRRAVFILHDLDDLPIPEIARALGINVNTAYSRLRIAREKFTSAVKRLRRRRGES